jgi:hypothetical protein
MRRVRGWISIGVVAQNFIDSVFKERSVISFGVIAELH